MHRNPPTRKHALGVATSIRNAKHRRLLALPHVVGTMIGRKYVDGVRQSDLSVVVMVDKKRARTRLGSDEIVPTTLRVDGKSVKTDVMSVGTLRPQKWTKAIRCTDGLERGLVTLFWREESAIKGMTCAHVVAGHDKDPFTPTSVKLRPTGGKDLVVGQSGPAFNNSGRGIQDDFGFDDVALFGVEPSWAQADAANLPRLEVSAASESTNRLIAETEHGSLEGTVRGVNAVFDAAYCDFVIGVDYPGTYDGDSGALWRTPSRRGVAIHARGGFDYGGAGSSVTAAMSLLRILKKLGIPRDALLAP